MNPPSGGPSALIQIDPSTGAATSVCSSGWPELRGLAAVTVGADYGNGVIELGEQGDGSDGRGALG